MKASQPQLSLPHLVRMPPATADPPAVMLCLHGRGSDAGDLLGLAPYLDDRLLWISPRAPLTLGDGFEWYRLQAVGVPEPDSFQAAVTTLARFLAEALAAYRVDPRRVILFGFSQGGMMAHTLALTGRASDVAGVIAHSSYIPLPAITAAYGVDAAGVAGRPFLLAHGVQDPVIPAAWGRAARDTLTQLGAAVTYHEFAGGHTVSDSSLAAMRRWLAERRLTDGD